MLKTVRRFNSQEFLFNSLFWLTKIDTEFLSFLQSVSFILQSLEDCLKVYHWLRGVVENGKRLIIGRTAQARRVNAIKQPQQHLATEEFFFSGVLSSADRTEPNHQPASRFKDIRDPSCLSHRFGLALRQVFKLHHDANKLGRLFP